MEDLNGRELANVRLHAVIYVPSVGQMGTTLDKDSDKKNGLGTVKLFKVQGGVQLVGKNWEAYIPDGNIICMTFNAK